MRPAGAPPARGDRRPWRQRSGSRSRRSQYCAVSNANIKILCPPLKCSVFLSRCRGIAIGWRGRWRSHEDPGGKHVPDSKRGRRFGLVMLPGLHAPDCARQLSFCKRAGQVPSGSSLRVRVSLPGCGISAPARTRGGSVGAGCCFALTRRGVPERLYGHGKLLRMRPAGAPPARGDRRPWRQRSGSRSRRSQYCAVSNANIKILCPPLKCSVFLSRCRGIAIGWRGRWRSHEDPGGKHVPDSKRGRRFGLVMLPGLHAPDCARQLSFCKRAGQVPSGSSLRVRVSLPGCGISAPARTRGGSVGAGCCFALTRGDCRNRPLRVAPRRCLEARAAILPSSRPCVAMARVPVGASRGGGQGLRAVDAPAVQL